MAKWSNAELEALRETADYEAFAQRTQYSKTYDAWEVKRRRVGRGPDAEEWSPLRIQRAIANNVKVARQIIRLRHSVEADDELALVIPRIKAVLQGQAHAGQVTGLTYDDLRQLVYGNDRLTP